VAGEQRDEAALAARRPRGRSRRARSSG